MHCFTEQYAKRCEDFFMEQDAKRWDNFVYGEVCTEVGRNFLWSNTQKGAMKYFGYNNLPNKVYFLPSNTQMV